MVPLNLRVVAALVVSAVVAATVRTDTLDLAAGKDRIRSWVAGVLGKPPSLAPSMSIAVVQNDAIVWEEAFGWADQERRIAATPATPYYLASVSKVFTSTALALLARQGRVDMSRSVNAYLGAHKIRPALWDDNAITVRRVANQMSGLSTFDLSCAAPAPCRLESALDRFGVIVRPPGAAFDYSNLNYGILGAVVAQASGQTYAGYLRRAIFGPLGMRDCGIGPDALPSRNAVRYEFGTTRGTERPYSASVGASGAFCSAHSLALFARALLNQSSAPSARRWSTLLPSDGVETGPGQPAGLMYNQGWWIQPDYVGVRAIDAMGGTSDSSAIVRLIPAERLAVIVLVNGASDYAHVADLIVDEFAPAIRDRRKSWTPPAAVPRPQPRPVAPELVGTWVGAIDTYRGRRELTLSIDAAGALTGSLRGVATTVTLMNGVASGPRVFGLLPGPDLGIDESKDGNYDVQLSLTLYGARLAGSASTRAHAGTVSMPVTFGAELAHP